MINQLVFARASIVFKGSEMAAQRLVMFEVWLVRWLFSM